MSNLKLSLNTNAADEDDEAEGSNQDVPSGSSKKETGWRHQRSVTMGVSTQKAAEIINGDQKKDRLTWGAYQMTPNWYWESCHLVERKRQRGVCPRTCSLM